MTSALGHQPAITPPPGISERVGAIDWKQVSQELDAQGSAIIERLLSPEECKTLASLYSRDELFRSRVVMERHGSGGANINILPIRCPT